MLPLSMAIDPAMGLRKEPTGKLGCERANWYISGHLVGAPYEPVGSNYARQFRAPGAPFDGFGCCWCGREQSSDGRGAKIFRAGVGATQLWNSKRVAPCIHDGRRDKAKGTQLSVLLTFWRRSASGLGSPS